MEKSMPEKETRSKPALRREMARVKAVPVNSLDAGREGQSKDWHLECGMSTSQWFVVLYQKANNW
jgi:hypothetical protein